MRCEERRPFEERGGRQQTTASPRPACRPLKLDGDLLVVTDCRTGPMPSAAVRVMDRVGHLRQGAMHFKSLLEGRAAVGGCPHQWMPEVHSLSYFEQPGAFCGGRGAPIEPEALSGGPQQRRVALRLGCCECEQGLGISWQFTDTLREGRFKPARERNTGRFREALNQFGRGPRTGQLKEREGIAACFSDDPIPNERIRWTADDRVEQPTSVLSVQAADREFRQPGKLVLVADVAGSDKNEYPLGE